MVVALMVAGLAAEIVAWRVTASRRLGVWLVMGSLFAALGLLVVLARPPLLSKDVAASTAAAAGLASGLILYLATRLAVGVLRRWEPFDRHVGESYAMGGDVSAALAFFVGVCVVAVGEELFWRGLFLFRLVRVAGRVAGSGLGWAAYVAANLPSGNLAIVAGAVVGGALWTALAFWSHGVLASVLSHGVWTGLMVSFPVVRPSAPGSAR